MQIPQTQKQIGYFVAQDSQQAMTKENNMTLALEFIDTMRKEDPDILTKLSGIVKVTPEGQKWVAVFSNNYFNN
jgi:hypothetical protein